MFFHLGIRRNIWDCEIPENEQDADDILQQLLEGTTRNSSYDADLATISW